jgi:hypothetical protein
MEGIKNMPEIFEYVRNNHGQAVGVVLATNNGIGWSALNPKDRFDREIALRIARGRAESGSATNIPRHVQERLTSFVNRAERYFKKEF